MRGEPGGFRRFQLTVMGILALTLGPVTWFIATIVHGYPFLGSISESGTIANQASPILPYCLGALSLFALSYAVMHSYDRLDKIVTYGMFAGFTVVAMQMCGSPYVHDGGVGVFGLSKGVSDIVHDAGAIVGFTCMVVWILKCFTKSDKPARYRTPEKMRRNKLYTFLGSGMVGSLFLFILHMLGVFGDEFPILFTVECMMLTFGGLACVIKGGMIFADK